MRRFVVIVAVVLGLLAPVGATAQFGTPQPGSEMDSDNGSGRTPRRPRRSAGEDAVATVAPLASAGPAHSETGATPPAPVGIARTSLRSHVDTQGTRAIALTLDDGYRPDHRILELIESYGVHGTAFIVGAVADSDPALLNDLARLGWLVCSHTYDHELLTGRSLEAIRGEMLRGIEAVERVVGYRCPYFRPPYGSADANVAAVADELGVELIGWEASLSDSAPKGTDPDLQLSIAQRDVRPGSIVLGHFGGTNSYEVLSRLLAWLGDEGYSAGSVTELIEGNTRPLGEVGTASVSVDVPGVTDRIDAVGGPAAVLPGRATATRPWSLSALELALDVAGVALLLLLVWRYRRRRRKRPHTLADLLVQSAAPEPERVEIEPPRVEIEPQRVEIERVAVVIEREPEPEPAASASEQVTVATDGWT